MAGTVPGLRSGARRKRGRPRSGASAENGLMDGLVEGTR